MKPLASLFLVLSSVFLLTACGPAVTEFGRVLGCTAKGTACNSQGNDGSAGATGATGQQGQPGTPGTPGTSCTVTTVAASPAAPAGGARVTCPDGTDALILNGSNGQAAPSMIGISQVVKPCPTVAGSYPEVFLVLTDRTILVSFSDTQTGAHTRLVALPAGSYQTTDGRACAVTVTATTISWAGGSVTY